VPKLSIIIPVYGVEKYLREALDSILNQTFTDFEVLLIDDGGKDSCPQIIDEYAQKDSRIKALHKANGGYGHTCNYGLSRATGEYVTIFEPDDYIESKMYEDLYNLAIKHDADIVKSNFYKQMDNIKDSNAYKMKWGESYNIPTDKAFKIQDYPQFLYFHPSIWSCIYKKEFLDKHNIKFVEAPGAGWTDNPFQVQTMCLAEKIVYTDEAYYHWRCVNIKECDDLKDYTLPFKRSDEIHQWLEENHITNKNILENLYRRELAYIHIVLNKEKISDKKDCYKRIIAMTKRMDSKIIYSSKNIWKRDKVFYYFCERNPKMAILTRRIIYMRKKLFSIRLNKREILIKLFGITFLHKSKQQKKQDYPYDIGIMGFWCGLNYGSVLTYYALVQVLQKLGNKVLMIEKPSFRSDFELDPNTHSRKFANKHYNISGFRTIDELPELNNFCHTFMLGSDQVFNPGCYKGFKNTLFFDFVNNDKKKIAYAASFGHPNINFPTTERIKLNYYLNKFEGVSVREASGLDTLNKLKVPGVHVLDPVFLCDHSKYEDLISEVPPLKDNDFILSYILDPNEDKRNLILKTAEIKNKKFINILDGLTHKYEKNNKLLNLENTLPPTNLPTILAHYQKANFVITDSFHGTCMAILFKKPFIAIANRHRGITRFESILKLLNLRHRLVFNITENTLNNPELFSNIDYNAVYKILDAEKEKSLNWLINVLNMPVKDKSDTIFGMLKYAYFNSNIENSYQILYLRYLKYKIFANVKKGTKKQHYIQKRDRLHNEVRAYRLKVSK